MIFSRIHPIVQLLLKSIQQIKNQTKWPLATPTQEQSTNEEEVDHSNQSIQHEKFITLLKSQCELLKVFQKTLLSLDTSFSSQSPTEINEDFVQTLQSFGEFITLPLLSILQPKYYFPDAESETKLANSSTISTHPKMNDDIGRRVELSLYYTCIEEVTRVLTTWVQLVCSRYVQESNVNSMIAVTNFAKLIHPIFLQCIISCIQSLQWVLSQHKQVDPKRKPTSTSRKTTETDSLQEEEDEQEEYEVDDSVCTQKQDDNYSHPIYRHPITLRSPTSSSLDSGDECMVALLSCIQILFGKNHDTLQTRTGTVSDAQLSQSLFFANVQEEFVNSYNGSFYIALIHCCLRSLSQDAEDPTNDSRNKDMSLQETMGTLNMSYRPNIRGNIHLQIMALDTLEMLLLFRNFHHDPMNSNVTEGNLVHRLEQRIQYIWRLVFPGCYMTLFHVTMTQVRFSAALSSSRLAARCLRVLSLLLNTTMTRINHEYISPSNDVGPINENSSNQPKILLSNLIKHVNTKSSMIDSAKKSSQGHYKHKASKDDQDDTSLDHVFFHKIRSRLPMSLTFLLRLVPNHRSVLVRSATVDFLCRCILVDNYSSWMNECEDDETIHDGLHGDHPWITTVRECVLTMCVDTDVGVHTVSREVIRLHYSRVGCYPWAMTNNMTSRIVELMQSLPTLAKAYKNQELGAKMNLINGYLTYIMLSGAKDDTVFMTHLASKLSESATRKSIIDILTLDNSLICSSALSIVRVNEKNYQNSFSICAVSNFIYLSRDTYLVAQALIDALGKTLGWKKCALFIDACIADMYDSFIQRTSTHSSCHDKPHGHWISCQCAVLVLVNELIKIGLEANDDQAYVTHALATSIIPMFLSDILWNLPSTYDLAKSMIANSSGKEECSPSILSHYFRAGPREMIHEMQIQSKRCDIEYREINTSALDGNAIFTAYMLEVVGCLCSLLQKTAHRFLPSLIYPIWEKGSDFNHRLVQQAAYHSLHRISTACRFSSLTELLSALFNPLMDSIAHDLQTKCSNAQNRNYYRMITGFDCLRRVLELILGRPPVDDNRLSKLHSDNEQTVARTVILVDTVESLLHWFDINVDKDNHSLCDNILVPLGVIKICIVASRYFSECLIYDEELDYNRSDLSRCSLQREPKYLEVLREFSLDDDTDLSDFDDACVANKDVSTTLQTVIPGSVLVKPIRMTKRMLSLSAFLLSLPDIRVQKACYETFRYGIVTLGKIERYIKVTAINTDSESDLVNPLLVSVSYFWQNIQLLFRTCTMDLIYEKWRESGRSREKCQSQQELVESVKNLLLIISLCCELCGDFMERFFKEGVWPEIIKLMMFYHNVCGDGHIKNMGSDCLDPLLLRAMIMDIVNCLASVFSVNELSKSLNELVPVAGALLIPLLRQNDQIGLQALATMKSLLAIDSDALWRCLLYLSGGQIPRRPQCHDKEQRCGNEETTVTLGVFPTIDDEYSESVRLLQTRTKCLIEYANKLPESII